MGRFAAAISPRPFRRQPFRHWASSPQPFRRGSSFPAGILLATCYSYFSIKHPKSRIFSVFFSMALSIFLLVNPSHGFIAPQRRRWLMIPER
jgi:hypothetical protein